jgi:DNA mismatch endonuclease, patch repair protein
VDRSENMRQIRSKDTAPELIVRKLVYRLGYRYRLHRTDLPGKPDLVFSAKQKVIFVHGCFWHQHRCINRMPQSNQTYWVPKLARNKARDARNMRELRASGWNVLVIWECETKNTDVLAKVIRRFLR